MSARTEPVRVLLVEDDEDDYLITRDLLAAQDRTRFALDWAASYEAALAGIAGEAHDVYLIDYRLGARTGLELIREGFATRGLAPVILLTGQSDYEIDLEAAALGVTDYLVKQEIGPLTLERSIRYAISHHRAMASLARSEERYALAVRAANDGIWDWDLEAGTVYFSPRWYAILGLAEPLLDPSPQSWFERVHPDDLDGLQTAIDLHLRGEAEHLASEHRMRHADGTWRWVLSRGLAIRDANAQPARMAGSLTDITERHVAQRKLEHDALHDGLTGLPNRVLFADRVDQLLARSHRHPEMNCAVLFLDIDRFKLVNDSLSHLVGDQLLVAFAARLRGILRPGDTVARVGGDEFTILLADGVDEPGARLVADRLQEQLRAPFRLGGRELFLSASVGIALSQQRLGASELVRNADIAMYDAKRSGRGQTAVFDQSMHRRVVTRLSRQADRGALPADRRPRQRPHHRSRGARALAPRVGGGRSARVHPHRGGDGPRGAARRAGDAPGPAGPGRLAGGRRRRPGAAGERQRVQPPARRP
jgi:diguanylate cyclase (GGDEF)-like protein/PAS domain S-box-containing protein